MKELHIGKKCFWAGQIGEIIGQNGKGFWILDLEGSVARDNTTFSVPKSECEPIAQEVFQLDVFVHAVYQGNCGFQGYVVGFEPKTNRVVCVPKAGYNTKDRSRFSYKVTEISNEPGMFEFKPGVQYELHHICKDKQRVLAVEHPCSEGDILLYDVKNGTAVGAFPRKVAKEDLAAVVRIKDIKRVY
jgi:hypothetical protein